MSQPPLPGQHRMQELGEARELSALLRAVGDPVRLQVLRQLARNEEMSVNALVQAVRVSQPLLSWHLGVLRRSGLVDMRKEGRLVWYSLNRQAMRSFDERLHMWIEELPGSTGEEREEYD
jgi:DNA-binding transcriptional ArsR family regulator